MSSIKSESLPDIAKFQAKSSVAQGVVKFGNGDTFTAYGFKSGGTSTVSMDSIYKSEKGGAPKAKSPTAKVVKPKVSGGSKAIKKSPKKGSGAIASKLSKYTPGGKKTLPKKSVGAVGGGTMASPGDGLSAAATAEAKTMKQFKQMIAYLKKSKGAKGGKKSSKK
jgi:hypothetical protein|tara:strand:+ start:597 stop:1091 length:495 start_codon:yes stop_codon:yes gene_type:complete